MLPFANLAGKNHHPILPVHPLLLSNSIVIIGNIIEFGCRLIVCLSGKWVNNFQSYINAFLNFLAGEYEYIDVMIGKERLLIDIDFKSEFEIARSTKAYKTILQNLPYIFVGKCDRLQSIVAIVSEAVKQSLKKKGMHVPPWRRAEYVRAKWLSPYTRVTPPPVTEKLQHLKGCNGGDSRVSVIALSESSGEDNKAVVEWKPPELKPKGSLSGVKVVTGLAAVFHDNE